MNEANDAEESDSTRSYAESTLSKLPVERQCGAFDGMQLRMPPDASFAKRSMGNPYTLVEGSIRCSRNVDGAG